MTGGPKKPTAGGTIALGIREYINEIRPYGVETREAAVEEPAMRRNPGVRTTMAKHL